jgi:YVTN family beta-propeller protein
MKDVFYKLIAGTVAGLLLVGLVTCNDKGTNPPPINTNPEGKLYVLNQNDSSMYIYDSHTLQLLDSMRSGISASPHHIEFDPQHEFAYIVGRTVPGQIARFRLLNDSIEATITAPFNINPTSMVTSGDGLTGYICDFNLGPNISHVHRVDLATMTFTDSIYQTGSQTHDIKATTSRQILVAANYYTDNVTIVYLDGDTVAFVNCAPGGNPPGAPEDGPYGIAINHNDSLVYIACRVSRKVRVLDLKFRTIVDSISVPGSAAQPAGPSLMVLNADNSRLYVTSQDDNLVHVINLTSRTLIKSIATGATRPFGVTFAQDESRLYVSCVNPLSRGRIYVINPATDEIVDSIIAGHGTYMSHHHARHE